MKKVKYAVLADLLCYGGGRLHNLFKALWDILVRKSVILLYISAIYRL